MTGLVKNTTGLVWGSAGLRTDGTGLTAGDGLTGDVPALPAGGDAFLLETGDNFLLETGDNLLLE